MTRVTGVFVVALLTPPIAASQSPDAARVLADIRAALGGEALDAVKGFSVEGDEERALGNFKTHSNVVAVDIRLWKFKTNPKVDPARFVPVR